jgi:hypothetical protein
VLQVIENKSVTFSRSIIPKVALDLSPAMMGNCHGGSQIEMAEPSLAGFTV